MFRFHFHRSSVWPQKPIWSCQWMFSRSFWRRQWEIMFGSISSDVIIVERTHARQTEATADFIIANVFNFVGGKPLSLSCYHFEFHYWPQLSFAFSFSVHYSVINYTATASSFTFCFHATFCCRTKQKLSSFLVGSNLYEKSTKPHESFQPFVRAKTNVGGLKFSL